MLIGPEQEKALFKRWEERGVEHVKQCLNRKVFSQAKRPIAEAWVQAKEEAAQRVREGEFLLKAEQKAAPKAATEERVKVLPKSQSADLKSKPRKKVSPKKAENAQPI